MHHSNPTPEPPRRWLTSEEVADLFGLTRQAICYQARHGLLPAVRLSSGEWRFPAVRVDALLRGEQS